MENSNYQRLTVYLRSGKEIQVDFAICDDNVYKPCDPILLLIRSIGDPEKQDLVVVFKGERLIGVRVGDVSAYEVMSFELKKKQREVAWIC